MLPRQTLALIALASATRLAAADPEHVSTTEPSATPPTESTAKPTPTPTESTDTKAADIAGAPLPGFESGRVDEIDGGDSVLRRGARGALYLPKLVVGAVISPVRLTVWAFDRYQLIDLYNRVFFNKARTIGIVPTAALESGFGFTAGARFVDRDVLGAREHLSLQAAFGGRYRQIYKGSLSSGDRLGDHVDVELRGQYELRPKDPFYGIGNYDDASMPPALVDPRTDPTAIETRYRERIERVAGVLDVRPFASFHIRSSNELTDRTFGASDTGVPIDMVYDPSGLVGYGGVRHVYSELELRLDDRRHADPLEPESFYAMGSLASVFGGRVHRIDGGTDYWRYGIDLQHFMRLAEGPRVLAVRLHGEAVSGTLAEVPFTELPHLGGSSYLRGYPVDRFRDRVAAVGSIEYEWDLSGVVSASLFVDAGRVAPSTGELTLDHLRVGYGIALEGHSSHTFAVQGSLASSIDGGLFLNLSFNPVFDLDERVRRR
jgi:hypothetical protein